MKQLASYPRLSRALNQVLMNQIFSEGDQRPLDRMTEQLGYKSSDMIKLWLAGTAAPPLATVRRLAELYDGDVLLAWCADCDPEGEDFYRELRVRLRAAGGQPTGAVDRGEEKE